MPLGDPMRNLWIFISKYNAFFFFAIFFVVSIMLVVKHNSYQRATFLNSSNLVIGEAYARINSYKTYLSLKETNDRLATENAALRSQLRSSFYDDSVVTGQVTDTLRKQQYTYIVARVVNNSTNQKDNMITINRGSRHGIKKGMGVITANGVVGIVKDVNEYYATVLSLLNSETSISATIEGSRAPGALIWGTKNFNPAYAVLQEIPNHIIVKPGARVVTTGFSPIFPANLPIGRVLRVNKRSGASFWDINVKLNIDFSSLDYVNVVVNLLAEKQVAIERKPDE